MRDGGGNDAPESLGSAWYSLGRFTAQNVTVRLRGWPFASDVAHLIGGQSHAGDPSTCCSVMHELSRICGRTLDDLYRWPATKVQDTIATSRRVSGW